MTCIGVNYVLFPFIYNSTKTFFAESEYTNFVFNIRAYPDLGNPFIIHILYLKQLSRYITVILIIKYLL